nr:MAG TPA: hypothetical protein [Crassvirales sp.]
MAVRACLFLCHVSECCFCLYASNSSKSIIDC